MNELSNQYSVELKSLEKGIYTDVIKQIIKDFQLVGLTPTWKEIDKPDVFWMEFIQVINELLLNEPEKVRALLYRVDLDESVLNTLVESTAIDKIAEFSRQILIRETQKVMSRLKNR